MAGDKEANLLIRLKDEVSDGLGRMRGSLLAVTAAFAGLTAFVISSVKSFLESEDAANKLNLALKNQGIFTKDLSNEMLAYAKQLQATTTFSDESIVRTEALLTTFGLAGKEIKQTTEAALNLSSAMGIDLNTASFLLGKAFQGQTEALARYGIKIDESIPKSERFAAVMDQVNHRFGGAAAAAAETTSGKIDILKNSFDDLKEEVGKAVIPVLQILIDKLLFVSRGVEQLGGFASTLALVIASSFADAIGVLAVMVDQIPALSGLFKLMGIDIDDVSAKMHAQVDAMLQAATDEQTINQQRLLNTQLTTQQGNAIREKLRQEDLKAMKKVEAEAMKTNEERVKRDIDAIDRHRKFEEDANQKRAENTRSTLQFISSLSTSHNAALAAIGKAAAIALATIDTYRAANLALASAPPPFNFALAAAVVAAGLANVSSIVGVKLAQGGMVMPSMGGTLAQIGEAGHREVVIPLGDERTKDALQDSGLGGNLTLNIGVLVGSEQNVRDLARIIDKELFSLRRNNESVAFGAL